MLLPKTPIRDPTVHRIAGLDLVVAERVAPEAQDAAAAVVEHLAHREEARGIVGDADAEHRLERGGAGAGGETRRRARRRAEERKRDVLVVHQRTA
jgi:hypothetical protein